MQSKSNVYFLKKVWKGREISAMAVYLGIPYGGRETIESISYTGF